MVGSHHSLEKYFVGCLSKLHLRLGALLVLAPRAGHHHALGSPNHLQDSLGVHGSGDVKPRGDCQPPCGRLPHRGPRAPLSPCALANGWPPPPLRAPGWSCSTGGSFPLHGVRHSLGLRTIQEGLALRGVPCRDGPSLDNHPPDLSLTRAHHRRLEKKTWTRPGDCRSLASCCPPQRGRGGSRVVVS